MLQHIISPFFVCLTGQGQSEFAKPIFPYTSDTKSLIFLPPFLSVPQEICTMTKRKASFSSQDSNDSRNTKRRTRGTRSHSSSSQSTERHLLSGQPVPRLGTTHSEDNEDIASGTSTPPSLTRIEPNNLRQAPTLRQQSAQGVGISPTLSARSSSPIPTTNRVVNLSSAHPVLSTLYPGYTSGASGILLSNSSNNAGATGGVPQMTCKLLLFI